MFFSALFLAPLASNNFLRLLGNISFRNGYRPFSPNWITFHSLIITLSGLLFYRSGTVWLGLWLTIYGAILDRYDGKVAFLLGKTLAPPSTWEKDLVDNIFADIESGKVISNQKIGRATTRIGKLWIEFNFAGTTDLGKVFDPFADKVKALTILITFSLSMEIPSFFLVIMLLIPEITGTLIRRPFNLIHKWVYQSASTSIGKYKAFLQWLVAGLCVPFHQHWLPLSSTGRWLVDGLMALTLLLAFVSVLSRFKPVRESKEVNGLIDSLDETVSHD